MKTAAARVTWETGATIKLRVQEVPGEDAVCGSVGVSPRQVWERRLGWKETSQGWERKNLSRGRLSCTQRP